MSETNKSVLVIDTPECCSKCKQTYIDYWDDTYCSLTGEYIEHYASDVKSPNCPLSPLPSHKDLTRYVQRGDAKSMTHMVQYMYDSGWNACREEILKGEK